MNTESCHCGLLSCKEVNTRDKDNKFTLQPLPYAENSLEPYISEKTVKFHYGKHLAAYIDNTNKLKAGTQFDDQPIHEIIKKASGGLFNNAAQVFNHYFYFEALHHSGAQAPRGKLSNLLEKNFGSFEDFKEKFTQAGTALFGSGWVWLVQEDDKLEIWPAPNAENPLKNLRVGIPVPVSVPPLPLTPFHVQVLVLLAEVVIFELPRSEERRVGKECRL